MKNRFFLFLLCFVTVPFASANSLVVQLSNNLPNDIAQNIQAYLGLAPTNKNEHAAFIFTAKQKTINALNALGYYRAVVTNTVNDELTDVSTLTIDVVLNQPIRIKQVDININGDALEDKAFSEFLREVPIAPGDILHHGVYEKFKENLISLGLERGYFDSKFITSTIAIHKDLNTADIIINFDSGSRYQFGEISLNFTDNDLSLNPNANGNSPNPSYINPDVLKPLISFKQGDYYQQTLLQNLQNELDKTQYFSHVVVRPDTEKIINNILPVDVSLEKEKSHQLDVGLGYATDTKENFSFGWKTPLVNRFGHRQETRLSYSKINPTGHFIYGIPLTHPNNDILQFKAVLEENDFGDLTSQFFSLQMGRVYLEDEILRQPYIRHLTEEWRTDGVFDDASYFIPGLSWSDKEWQGSVLDPTNGFRQYYNLEGSYEKFNSETSFLRFNARWKYISLIAPKHRFVARSEVGYVLVKNNDEQELSPSLRFYAGGDQSIRGFAYQSVGPKVTLSQGDNSGKSIVVGGTNMLVASMEYQYYFSNEWRGALFADGGSINDTDKLDFVYSIGTGIHYISPIGPIRFALGYPISEEDPSWRIHFSIGAEL